MDERESGMKCLFENSITHGGHGSWDTNRTNPGSRSSPLGYSDMSFTRVNTSPENTKVKLEFDIHSTLQIYKFYNLITH